MDYRTSWSEWRDSNSESTVKSELMVSNSVLNIGKIKRKINYCIYPSNVVWGYWGINWGQNFIVVRRAFPTEGGFFNHRGEEQPKVQHRCMEQYGALPIVSQIVEYHSE